MRAGFIGAGQMATALATGISRGGTVTEILVHDPDSSASMEFQQSLSGNPVQISACQTNQSVVDGSTHVFLAVKPQYAAVALQGLKVDPDSDLVFISIVAGWTIRRLASKMNSGNIIRAMPNTPCLIGCGAIAIAAAESVSRRDIEVVHNMLSTVGSVVEVPETLLDAVTGLSGSGPAFVFTFIEALIDGGVLAGLPRDIARQLAIQTVLGSTQLLKVSAEHPGVLRDRVTSPGGTSIYGMAELEETGFRSSVMAAVHAAAQRAGEL